MYMYIYTHMSVVGFERLLEYSRGKTYMHPYMYAHTHHSLWTLKIYLNIAGNKHAHIHT